ncbi:hypothetical protein MTO96_050581, partial [Rhipicephalus appendiculatus]
MHLLVAVSYGRHKLSRQCETPHSEWLSIEHGQNFTHNYQNQVKLVRKLLEQKRYLT